MARSVLFASLLHVAASSRAAFHLDVRGTLASSTSNLATADDDTPQQQTCGAAAGCGTKAGADYSSQRTCMRYAAARGCKWFPGAECCGRAEIVSSNETVKLQPSSSEIPPHHCSACAADVLEDADRDGIPDCVETPGCKFYGLPLHEWGARPGIRDIFLEIDWMAAPAGDEGVAPRPEAIQKLVRAFQSAGARRKDIKVALHVDMGNLGGGNEVPYMKTLIQGRGHDQFDTINHIRSAHQDKVRRTIFYYILFGSTVNRHGFDGPSGGSRIKGTLAYVTLGGWELHSKTDADRNFLINTQASTAMHELGHTLGLRHGGDDNTQNKPNYISIMNYMYQSSGLPQVGGIAEGDRWYIDHPKCHSRLCGTNMNCEWDDLVRSLAAGPYSSDFRIDYSDGKANPIDELEVNEHGGLANQAGIDSPVDFDCNGSLSSSSMPLILHECMDDVLSRFDPSMPDQNDACGGRKGTTAKPTILKDFDDWRGLFLFFGEAYESKAIRIDVDAYLSHMQAFADFNKISFLEAHPRN